MSRVTVHLATLAAITSLALTGCGTDSGYEEAQGAETPVRVERAERPARSSIDVILPEREEAVTGETAELEPAPAVPAVADVVPAATPHGAFLQAQALYSRGEREGAIGLLRSSIAGRDGFPHAHYLLGLALRKTGDLDGSERSLRRTLELDDSHVRARVNLARVLIDTDRAAEALDALEKIPAEDREDGDLWNVLGLARLSTGELEAAVGAFEAAASIDPASPYAPNNLGLALIRRGRFEEAVEPLRRAAAIEGAPAYVLNNLGIALERSGRHTEALDAFAGAMDRGHSHAARSHARVEPLARAEVRRGSETETDERTLAAVEETGPETASP